MAYVLRYVMLALLVAMEMLAIVVFSSFHISHFAI